MITHEVYFKVKPWYWVPRFKKGYAWQGICRNSFKFSLDKPESVDNPNMDWEHPTWEELCDYQNRWQDIHRKFIDRRYI